ncbi:hypothetical protein RHMOL_Rhmol01G0199300 [Rhododendron molle]|uniref:Uncharacterized protein n=1 Tax=Rhododendron molle TaxID=49168 RepID=A0ACC0Q4V6_RHOML|nr:hypothetical protein RHMOL_Rhmol01G0199300 [Rhododendron molle]
MLSRQCVGVTDLSVSMGFTGGGVAECGDRDLSAGGCCLRQWAAEGGGVWMCLD